MRYQAEHQMNVQLSTDEGKMEDTGETGVNYN